MFSIEEGKDGRIIVKRTKINGIPDLKLSPINQLPPQIQRRISVLELALLNVARQSSDQHKQALRVTTDEVEVRVFQDKLRWLLGRPQTIGRESILRLNRKDGSLPVDIITVRSSQLSPTGLPEIDLGEGGDGFLSLAQEFNALAEGKVKVTFVYRQNLDND